MGTEKGIYLAGPAAAFEISSRVSALFTAGAANLKEMRMISKELSVEDIVKARCPSCSEAQNHTVIEVIDERTTRIRCNVCEEVCVYKGKKAPKSPRIARKDAPSTRARAAQTASERGEWASLRPSMQPEEAIPYSMTGTYHARDLLQHLSFGLGLVVREAGPHKIEVLFQEGKKLLCCQ